MENGSAIRVKFTFGTKCKLAKLDKASNTAFSSMANLRELIYKHLPEIKELVERPQQTKKLLDVKCKDPDGVDITLENDDDLDAMELARNNNVEFSIDVNSVPLSVAHPASKNVMPAGMIANPTSAKLPSRNYKTRPCRNFQSAGFCSYGERCFFLHDPAGSSRAQQDPAHASLETEGLASSSAGLVDTRGGPDYDDWLNYQVGLNSAANIEQMSSRDNGLPMLFMVVKEEVLPHDTIARFVKLLAREEIRTSLLRQKTNQIYGALIGSPFLLQLNAHIESHLGMLPTLKPQDVRPYLALTEELQSRTSDGYKEVPLIALKSVISKLENSVDKDELNATVSRLADQGERLRRVLAVAPTEDKSFEGEKFRQMSIVPDKAELLDFQTNKNLPVNRIGIQYSRVSDYLETHFQLLREDCIDPLRQGIKAYRSNRSDTKANAKHSESSAISDLRIYLGVQLAGVRCGDQGVEFVLSFQLPSNKKTIEQWELSQKMMNGALLCISSDNFETFSWAVVSRRDVKELAKGLVAIRSIGENDSNFTSGLQNGHPSTEQFVMVESTASYFEAYSHVLRTLQRQDMEYIPFTPYLLHMEPKVTPPSYLLQRQSGDEYDFSCAFPDIRETLGKTSIRITEPEWPSSWADSLDRAQRDALKHGLTKQLAIIQGPPGTGKTFLGLILVKLLLANLKRGPGHEINHANGAQPQEGSSCDLSGPILLICYTNHALDQFLEGIYRNGETDLIRIGGRGKSETLKDRTLHSLLMKQRMNKGVEQTHSRFFARRRNEKDVLESRIHGCIDEMGVKFVTEAMLSGIATREQIQSLSWGQSRNSSFRQTVKLWLTEADPKLAHHFLNINLEDNEPGTRLSQPGDKTSRGLMKLLPKSEAHQDGEWIQVRRRGRPDARRPGADVVVEPIEANEDPDNENQRRLDIADEEHLGDEADNDLHQNFALNEGLTAEEIRLASDVWQLHLEQRRQLHDYWLEEIRKRKRRKLRTLSEQYEQACREAKEVDDEIQLYYLRKAKVVGMTTTAAAKYHDVLKC